ncbi:putative ammonium transporter [Scheffersomyces xylosifermentans]|uniref:putative ammonium transporter n=1 Tax=Scheffersomyces xylosifermentans TaxID=1304137 RepID=UPI00315DD9FD
MSEDGQLVDIRAGLNSLYMIYCTSLLPIVVVGIAFFYSGLTQRRSSMTMFALPILLTPLVFIDWFIWGYSLCYSKAENKFIGNLDYAVLRHLRVSITSIYTNTRGDIFSLNHFLFNGLFKVICAGLTFPGCIAERGRILPMLVFLFCWSTIIYNPITYWFWNPNGWLSVDLNKLPVLDFAGGNCIHVVSGFTSLAYSYMLGPRNPKILYNYRNINTGHIIFGTFLVACGWVGFVGGCDFKFSVYSLYIFVNTILCSCVGGIVWMSIDYYYSSIPLEGTTLQEPQPVTAPLDLNEGISPRGTNLIPVISETGVLLNQHYRESKSNFIARRKFSMISFSSGVMTGLVVITPGGGYVSSPSEFWKSFVFGVVGAVVCNLSTRLKYFFRIDDALDIFAIHGIAGIVGSLLTGIFANKQYNSQGGWVEGHWKQLGYQVLGCVVTSSYVFILTCVFLYLIDLIPGLHLRIDKNFNRRMREESLRAKGKGEVDEESQMTPTDKPAPEISYLEAAELLGTDCYEFNGEYMMDFVEFIKVIRPQDYEDDEVEELYANENNQCENIHGMGSDFEMHPEGANHLTKRE